MHARFRWIHLAAIVSVILTTAVGNAWVLAQQSLRGQIFAPDGKSWAHEVRFMIVSADGSFQQYFFTDSKGGFIVPGLRRGRVYTLIVDGDGETYETTRVEVNLEQVQYVPVFLNPRANSKSRPSGGTVNVGTLTAPPAALKAYEGAVARVKAGKLEDSIRLFEKAIEAAPDFFEAANDLGVVYLKLQRFPEAEKTLKRAVELRSGDYRPLLNLGIVLFRRQQYAEAADALARCLKIQGGLVETERYLGESLLELGRFDEADQHLTLAMAAKDENRPYAMIKLAIVKVQKNDTAAAIQLLESYLTDYPKAGNRAEIERILKQLK